MVMLYHTESYPQANDEAAVKAKIRECRGSKLKKCRDWWGPALEKYHGIASGELTFCHGKSPFLMGKSTISMAIFHCYVSSPEGIPTLWGEMRDIPMVAKFPHKKWWHVLLWEKRWEIIGWNWVPQLETSPREDEKYSGFDFRWHVIIFYPNTY